MAKAKTTPRQAHKAAQQKLETLKLEAEAKAMQQTLALLESPQPVVVPWREYPAYDDWGMTGSPYERPYFWTNPDDYTEGRYRPYYEDAFDVRRMRAEARSMLGIFSVARGALRKLSDYVLGNGFEYVVQPKEAYKKDAVAIQLASFIQKHVDRFIEHNKFVGGLDREIHESSRVDGDAFPALYPEEGLVRCEMLDPGCILEPANKKPLEYHLGTSHKLNGWWHGVHTVWNPQLKRDDVTRPLGYHAVFDRLGDCWDYLPASRVEHIKRVVGPLGRVGVSEFTIVQQDLENEYKLRRNTAIGAAILAAIVGIRQHAEGATRSTVESMVTGNSTNNYDKRLGDGTTRTTYQQNVAPGTIKDIPQGMEWITGPLGELRSPVYIEVDAHLLRIIGQRWSFPEFLMSSDASNANYASTLVAESPFVKFCEHEQNTFASHFERLIWKALAMLYHMGRLGSYSWEQICTLLEINAEYTSPASRDKKQQAETNAILNEKGILSKRSWAADTGLDYDEEQQNQASEPKAEPKVVQVPGSSAFGSPFAQKQLPFEPEYESARTETLAIRAMDVLMEQSRPISEIIRKLPNGKYRLYSHDGKNLGTFDSEEAAKKHEAEVEYFKSKAE